MENDIESDDENLDFSEIFGAFRAESIEYGKEPVFKIVAVDREHAQPCRCCGEQPALHIADFKDKKRYPDNVYICCSHCSEGDGTWYPDRESALNAWNEQNFGALPRTNRDEEDIFDFTKRIMKNFKMVD